MADTWSQEQLVEATEDGSIDTVILAFTDHYGRLMGKRLDAEFFLEDPSGTHACDYLLTVDMEMEPLDGFAFSNCFTLYTTDPAAERECLDRGGRPRI